MPPERPGSETAAVGPLDLPDALRVLWEEGDDRPLLVLRECTLCKDSDDALFDRTKINERTVLLTKWFRTVRLPPTAAWDTHPFYRVFADYQWKGATPHFFLLAEPGAKPVEFSGTQTQSELQRGMCEVLSLRYAKDPTKAVKAWLQLLSTLDALDVRRDQLDAQLEEARAATGFDSTRIKKLEGQKQQNAVEHAEAMQRMEEVRDLGLLPMSRAALSPAGTK